MRTWREVSPGPEGYQLEALPEDEEAGEEDGAAVEAPEGGVAGRRLRQLYHSRYLWPGRLNRMNMCDRIWEFSTQAWSPWTEGETRPA